jgi:hypothetical protein
LHFGNFRAAMRTMFHSDGNSSKAGGADPHRKSGSAIGTQNAVR